MMSGKLVEHVKDGKNRCPNCNKAYDKDDVISLSYTPEELETTKKKMLANYEKVKFDLTNNTLTVNFFLEFIKNRILKELRMK